MRCITLCFLPTLLAIVCSGCDGGGGELRPTAKMSGIRFGELDRATLLDVLEEEHDRVSKRQF